MSEPDSAQEPTGNWDGRDSDAASDARVPALRERDLLFGRLAVVNGLIDQAVLDDALQHWTDPSKSLGDCLVESGAITDEDRTAIERLLDAHAIKHDDEARGLTRRSISDEPDRNPCSVRRKQHWCKLS